MNIVFEIFLYIDVFIIGVAAAVAFYHARAHFKPQPSTKHLTTAAKEVNLSKEVRDKLLLESQQNYQHILDQAAVDLSRELAVTAEKINTTIKNLAADIITKELEGFEKLFKDYQQTAANELTSANAQTETYQKELKAKLDAQTEQERQRLVSLIDNQLADAVLSFLNEAMQHEVDLGAQADYLIKLLDEHKSEFKDAVVGHESAKA